MNIRKVIIFSSLISANIVIWYEILGMTTLADVKAISGIKDIQVLLNFYSHTTNEDQDKVLDVTRL